MGWRDVAYAGAVRDLAFFSALGGGFCPALMDGLLFMVLCWLTDVARHPGLVACAASGRGQGLAQPLAPYDPQPRVGAAIPDGQHDYAGNALCPLPAARQRAFGLPLPRAHAGRASVRRRSFRPCGAAISSAPCHAYTSKAVASFLPTNGMSSLNAERKKRSSPY